MCENDAVALFDTLYTTNHIQMMKILLPHLPREQQHAMAVYIKMQELQYTMTHTRPSSACLQAQEKNQPITIDFGTLLPQLLPYCTTKEKKMMEQIMTLKNNMEKYKEMMNMMQMLEPMMSSDNGSFDIMNLAKNMLSEDQMAMFEMFQKENENHE